MIRFKLVILNISKKYLNGLEEEFKNISSKTPSAKKASKVEEIKEKSKEKISDDLTGDPLILLPGAAQPFHMPYPIGVRSPSM